MKLDPTYKTVLEILYSEWVKAGDNQLTIHESKFTTITRNGTDYSFLNRLLRTLDDRYRIIYLVTTAYDEANEHAEYLGLDSSSIAKQFYGIDGPSREQIGYIEKVVKSYAIIIEPLFLTFLNEIRISEGEKPLKPAGTLMDYPVNQTMVALHGKYVRLVHRGHSIDLKRFKSTKLSNYIIFKKLYSNPDVPKTKEDLDSAAVKTLLRELPKMMGFETELRDIFFTINAKDRTIMFHPSKNLDSREDEILNRYVKRKKH